MTSNSSRLFSNATQRQCRAGLTLIEVIAGLALMGTLLSSLMLAYSAHLRQHHRAQQRLVAIEALDRQLQDWRFQFRGLPQFDTGALAGSPFNWRILRLRRDDADRFLARIIRIEVFDQREPRRILCSVEMLQHKPDESP